ncbi:MAG TPA: hypothetical protein VFU90_06125 [Candidatus Tumulicola sp.]|nr:hypothetical protein [Candidatus Tumulicola sp.]
MKFRRVTLLLVLAVAACSHAKTSSNPATPTAAPTPAPTPTARVRPAPEPRPSAGGSSPSATGGPATPAPRLIVQPTPGPVTTPTGGAPAASAAPTATPQPESSVPLLPPNAPPRIVAVDISETTVHSGDTVSGMVITSSNVASVEVRVATYGMSLAKIGVGRFSLEYTVGSLPFFVHGTYQMRIIARNTRGDATQTTLPITVP